MTRSGRALKSQNATSNRVLSADDVAQRIHQLRGQRVLLDADLARLYGVQTRVLNQAVGRNLTRFPPDFMFRLTAAEATSLKSQIVTSNSGRGGRRRSTPRAFTEQGVAMLSGVLHSPSAIAANIEIKSLRVVFDAIRAMQAPAVTTRKPLGFRPGRRRPFVDWTKDARLADSLRSSRRRAGRSRGVSSRASSLSHSSTNTPTQSYTACATCSSSARRRLLSRTNSAVHALAAALPPGTVERPAALTGRLV